MFHLDFYSVCGSPFIPDNRIQNIYYFDRKANYQAPKDNTVWPI